MKRIINLFNHKYAAPVCIFIAIACRFINTLFVSYAGRDKMLLVLQSKNFLEGKGLGIQKYFLDQLDSPVYDFTQLWPPGYSLVLAPFLKIFNYNVYWATTTLDILVGVGLILIARKICVQIKFPVAPTNFMTLIIGCFEYPFTESSLPTDSISLLFVLIGISFILKATAEKNTSFSQLFLTSFFLFLPCFFRYAYPPICLAATLIIIFYGVTIKDRPLIKKGIWLTSMTALMIAIFFIFLKTYSGQAGYILQTARGYFPENLINWYPVIPGSFIDFPFFTSQVIKTTGLSLRTVMQILEIINITSLVVLVILFAYWFFYKKIFRSITKAKWLMLVGIAVSAATFFSLGWLSFTYEMQRGYINDWNYISEGRYYAVVIVLLQFGFLAWIFCYKDWKKSFWQKAIIGFCSLVLFIEVSHSIYFHTKVAFHFKDYKAAVYREMDYNYFNTLLPQLEREYPGHEIIVTAPGDDFYAISAVYYGKKGVFDGSNLKKQLPKVKRKSLLVVMLYDHELLSYSSFVTNVKTMKLQKVDYSNFYGIELYP